MWKFYSTLNTIFPLPSWLFKTIPRRIKFTTKLSNYNTFNIKKKNVSAIKFFHSSKSFFLPSSQTIRSLLAESRRVNGGFWGGEKKKRKKGREKPCLIYIRGWEAPSLVVKWPPATSCFIVTPPKGATDFPAGWIEECHRAIPIKWLNLRFVFIRALLPANLRGS